LSDDDLKVRLLGFMPRVEIKNPELRAKFLEECGRDFLGGDEIVAFSHAVVSRGVDFQVIEEDILKELGNNKIRDVVWKKTATGIGRGHSLGGLAGVTLGINGTKMIDSGLTGFVASRSLVTSSRRRETTADDIVVPKVLEARRELLREYIEMSRDVFKLSEEFKAKLGKAGGVELFNKVIPYNSPADLEIVMPLDTLACLKFEVEADRKKPKHYVPRELYVLADMLDGITEKAGMGVMFQQRTRVPRDGYLHYSVFKDPKLPNYALEEAEMRGMPDSPLVLESSKDISAGFRRGLENVTARYEEARAETNPAKLVEKTMNAMLAMREFVGEHNEAIRVKVLDSLSWRVWSEQKRHATLRQNVESVYSGIGRALRVMKGLAGTIKEISENDSVEIPFAEFEKAISIDERVKKNRELAVKYIQQTAKHLMFYEKLLNAGIEERDALFAAPKNIRLRTIGHYDLINLVDLELPLRLCSTCEPERQATSWKKRDAIALAVPEIAYFLQPKCNMGMCTEGKPCGRIRRSDYTAELHHQVKGVMLGQ